MRDELEDELRTRVLRGSLIMANARPISGHVSSEDPPL